MGEKLRKLRLNTKVMFLVGVLIGLIISATGIYAATLVDSVDVTYDNSSSSLESSDVQNALDELYGICKITTLSSYVTDLFTSSTQISVTTAGEEEITQASDVSLMEDSDGNIRYYGASPSNYVYFNDEYWRIIGVFEVEDDKGVTQKRVKLVRLNSLGSYTFDRKQAGYGSSVTSDGSNDWSDAQLMMLLNPGYVDGAYDSDGNVIYEYEGSLYWNASSGTCYYGSSSTRSCSFSTSGLSDDAKTLIGQVKYYLGGVPINSYTTLYADDFYSFENFYTGSATVYSGHATDWTGYVALMYVSDYAYAADLSVCAEYVSQYTSDTTNCTGTDWLYETSTFFTLTPDSTNSMLEFVISSGNISYVVTFGANVIYPVVYLNADVTVVSGNGTYSNPYILS